jgi:hypothetical protein
MEPGDGIFRNKAMRHGVPFAVVLERDPSENVQAFAAVRYTIRDGKMIYKLMQK